MEKKKIDALVQAAIDAYHSHDQVSTDPDGSYTGQADPPWDLPVQDADDL